MEHFLFKTHSPNDHIPRALDILRKMGFDLHALSAERADTGSFVVRLEYRSQGALTSQTFAARLAQIDGLQVCMPHLASRSAGLAAATCFSGMPANFATCQAEGAR